MEDVAKTEADLLIGIHRLLVLQKQWKYVRRPEYIVSFLQPGRLIKVSSPLTLIAMMFPLLAFNWVIGTVH